MGDTDIRFFYSWQLQRKLTKTMNYISERIEEI